MPSQETMIQDRELKTLLSQLRVIEEEFEASRERAENAESELKETRSALRSREQELDAAQKMLRDQRQELSATQNELNLAREQAMQASSKVRTDYLGSVGQDIQSSMNSIMEMSALLAETFLDAEQEEFVNSLWQSASSLLGMLNNILEISQIEAGTLKLNPSSFDPRETLAEVVDSSEEHVDAKSLGLECEVDPRCPRRVIGDEERIRQVLVNLVENAVKHTSSGRVQLSLEYEETPDSIALLRFAVIDSGCGIPEEKLARIFDAPAAPQGVSAMPSPHSTSMSLPLSRQLVELMGGKMDVESLENEGTSFFFELKLPVIEPANDDDQAESAGVIEVQSVTEDHPAGEAS